MVINLMTIFLAKVSKVSLANTARALVLVKVTNYLHYRDCLRQFSYTPNGNLYQKIQNGELELEYGYNMNGSITSVKAKSQMETRYTYDIAGRLKTVNDGQSQVAQYSYNPDSTISHILYNTGANVAYQYDRDKNITNLINKNQQGDILSSYGYTYDNNGNQKSKIENGETTYYTYDNLNRLSSVKYPTAGTENYTYDNAGNRLSKDNYKAAGGVPTVNISTAYTYDSLNRMTDSLTDDILLAYKGRTTYEYDNNGSLLSETTTQLDYATGQILTTDPETGLPLQPQAKTYSYNAFNQNISVTNADGTFQQNMYDALGLRISTIENGYRSDYVFDRESIIAEFDGSGTLTSRNIRGYGLLAQKDDKGRLNYYLHNAHGDVTSLIDPSGKVLNSYQYDAFGNTMTYSATVANRFRYAGEQLDPITGQYYLRARYYDPQVGRFTQEDTYRGDGLNLYAYVANNPVNYVDSSGLERIVVSGGLYGNSTDYEYEFIDSALKEIISHSGKEKSTLSVALAGYSEDDLDRINEFSEHYGFDVFTFTDVTDLINYINDGSDNNRDEDLITKYTVFSHGYTGSIEFGHGLGLDEDAKEKLSFTIDKIGLLDSNAFKNTESVFYSCNTGTEINGKSFAQEWSNVTGGETKAVIGKTVYNEINAFVWWRADSWLLYKGLRELYGGYSSPYPAFSKPRAAKDAEWKTYKPKCETYEQQ